MKKKLGLLPKLVMGILSGILIGYICKTTDFYMPVRMLTTFSGIFGNLLNFIIPLIIIGFVVPGIVDMGKASGKILGVTVIIAYVSTMIAGMLAFTVGTSILPKILKVGTLAEKSSIKLDPYFTINMIPIMDVMAALIISFIFGICISHIKGDQFKKIFVELQQIVELLIKNVIVLFLPIHICGIFAKLTAAGDIVNTIKSFSMVFLIVLILHLVHILFQYTVAWGVTGKKPLGAIKNVLPAYFTAVGTQSSAATIPVTINCSNKNGVSKEVTDFVIPLCATIHLAGDTITITLTSIAVMLMCGQTPTLALYIPFILMLGVTMVAAPGVPGGGIYASMGLLKTMLAFTPAQQAIMIAIFVSQDSFGTATNVAGDCAVALIIDKMFKKDINIQKKSVDVA